MSEYKSSEGLIKAIKNDDRNALEYLYNHQRDHFLSWANKRFDCSQDTLIDAFQDAIVAFYYNIKNNKLNDLTSSPEAYLFGISRNLLLKKLAKERQVRLSEDIQEDWIGDMDLNLYNRIEDNHRKEMLRDAFGKLADSCRKLLQLFYYDRFSIESIQINLGYSSQGAVKTRKVQCLKKLRSFVEFSDQ